MRRAVAASAAPASRIARRRLPAALAFVALAALAGSAAARPFDAKALARYDRSYVQCEAANPEMKGRRDDAWLDLWHVPTDEKSKARLAKLRADPAYAAEQQRAAKTATGASAPAAATLQRQCRGLWAEHQRVAAEAATKKRP